MDSLGKGSISHHFYGIQPQSPDYHPGVLNSLRYPALNYVVVFCGRGGIRTLSAERRQIYSLFQLSNSGALPGTEVILQVQNYSFVCEINLLYDFHMCALGWIRTNVRVTFLIPNLFVGKTLGGFRDASLTTSYFSLLYTKTLIFFLICIQSSICQCSLVYQTFI